MPHVSIFIDTSVLIYALHAEPPPHAVNLCQRACQLINEAREGGHNVCISIITVAEYMVKIAPPARIVTEAHLFSAFRVVPFDRMAAREAARIHGDIAGDPSRIEGVPRPVLKADTQILGCAIASGTGRFITGDRGFLNLARRYIVESHELPPLRPEQPELPIPDVVGPR